MPVFENNFPVSKRHNDDLVLTPREVLRNSGPNIDIVVSGMRNNDAQVISGHALLDTGARFTAIDEQVCQSLQLVPTDVISMSHADGVSERTCYPVMITFPQLQMPPVKMPRAVSVNLNGQRQPVIALIGRDILDRIVLTYNGLRGRIEIAY